MDFALLGVDADSLALARAAVRLGHRLTMAAEVTAAESVVRELAPAAHLAPEWESLSGGIVPAIIVAGGDGEARARQLGKLAAEQIALLIVHPAHSSLLFHFELEMIRRDSGSVLLPYAPALWHPAVDHLAARLAAGDFGELRQLVCERRLTQPTPAAVLREFSVDALWLSRLIGDVAKVGAIRSVESAAAKAADATFGVQLMGSAGSLAHWCVLPAESSGPRQVSLLTTRGQWMLHTPADGGSWTVSGPALGPPQEIAGDPAERAVREFFRRGEAGRTAEQDVPRDVAGAADELVHDLRTEPIGWHHAVRSAELTDAVERSLRRGRVIELKLEEQSEEGNFKGVMTALGCGLLLLAPVVLVVFAIVDRAGLRFGRTWPWVFVLLLGAFLALQILRWLVPRRESPSAAQAAAHPDDVESHPAGKT